MATKLAFSNGEFISPEQLSVPVSDRGFMQGATVAEQLRTFGGRLFSLDEHLARLEQSLRIVGVTPRFSMRDLGAFAKELAANNHALLPAGDDLGLSLFVTPGGYPTFSPEASEPFVAMHTYPLPFAQWVELYENGQSLVVTEVRQVPESCWPAELKCRSRMHYFLADRRAAEIERGARALLLDQNDHVSEASTANVLIFRPEEGLLSPPSERILPGISVAKVKTLAAQLGIDVTHRALTESDVSSAEEVLLSSTSPCLIPVTRFNGRAVGDGRPGKTFRELMAAWSDAAGLDILAQARRFASR